MDTRLQLHHAVQVLTGFAQACVDERPDDRHRNFDWDPGLPGFRTWPASAHPDLTLALGVPSFEIRLERGDAVIDSVSATGIGLQDLRARVAAFVARATDRHGLRLEAPEFDLPPHPTADGAPFDPDPGALDALAGWYTDTFHELDRIVDESRAAAGGPDTKGSGAEHHGPVADEVRCWPHHFDLATLLYLESGRTIGAGMSPGDETYEHPYLYVRGYGPDGALDSPDPTPTLPTGHWHGTGWFGAVLTAEELEEPGEKDGALDVRRRRIGRWLDTAITVTRDLLRNPTD